MNEMIDLFYIVGSLLGIYIFCLILKSVLQMKVLLNHVRNQTMNLKVLRKIAEATALKNGITEEELSVMKDEAGLEFHAIENI